ncbi:hypothetical protein PABG_04268 [Paracoccidioides brasiliensis Pb03]|uniref:Uncharacterized protein n=1 Tax=Paracoccidioides brasiliensis (strain Pb18) TaxID=502780 RepID=C1GCB3_PARBD|nr:uncharacterized protein PADG_04635 [Paracoccidioides brasiliensis Pb18]EEH22057.2 hypothetical protein PABG_04268 [Paracoccidioides brasiliensis Pb03]EEH48556.2 hypothetical protein PADG_04635 [Paracoccidioides brasiliensis Pb18]ODH47155.1 hypothetical protein GX48_06750 [Paracoccidioides brasiliensis]
MDPTYFSVKRNWRLIGNDWKLVNLEAHKNTVRQLEDFKDFLHVSQERHQLHVNCSGFELEEDLEHRPLLEKIDHLAKLTRCKRHTIATCRGRLSNQFNVKAPFPETASIPNEQLPVNYD